ncbi:MAG: hypothetical protein M1836_002949 [Candelina mexicana]|nr:MAG: hypothetical protein M1836_002949 [Candelina mexicana]
MSSPSAVSELDAALQAMQSLKPPGVSGSKISSITALCNANVQSESVLIQKIYTHFKKTPGTHKLGVLYVVDSVTRQWVDQARKAGQPSGTAATDGTYAAGVNRVTELLPVLMSDIIQSAPEDQKEKIRKLVEIWGRGNTFPAPMLASFKDKLTAPPAQIMQSTTPDGSPPRDLQQSFGSQQPTNSAPAPDTSAILAALATMAKQNTSAAPTTNSYAAQDNTNNVTSAQNAVPQPVPSSVNQAVFLPPPAQPVNVPTSGASFPSQFAGGMNDTAQNTSNAQPNPLAALAAMLPQTNVPGGADALQQQLVILQQLAQAGVPQDQWATLLAAINPGGLNAPVPNVSNGVPPGWSQPEHAGGSNGWSGRDNFQSRDRNGFNEQSLRSPPNRYRARSRSRSPSGWNRGRESPVPRRRDSPIYGEYNGDSAGRNGNRGDNYDRRGRGRGGRGRGNDYRQRSPPPGRNGRSSSPRRQEPLPPPGPKWVDYDPSIGQGNIKVLSRTLFVGGVTSSEEDLRSIFSQFARVQTCIVNAEKRHGFVKLVTRKDALAAKEGMDHYKSPDMQLRTRWGVGFGPRDCSDYQTGVSIIPIDRLTEADNKWMLTAEYGGSGGKPIVSGMVVEEPDIEIGAGVSSKAISRRMATDQGGRQGPRSTRDRPDTGSRFRRPERHDGADQDRDVNTIGVPPPVPGFGFQFPPPMPNGVPNHIPGGMPIFPPGFLIPGSTPQAPPNSNVQAEES